jgi:hypothetical protein
MGGMMGVMNFRRLAMTAAVLAVLALATAFGVLQWANKILASVPALTGVVATGVSIWATRKGSSGAPQNDPHEVIYGRWLKLTESGRRLITELAPDGSVIEWDEDEPSKTWKGTWSPITDGLELKIGKYRATLHRSGNVFRGYEMDRGSSRSKLTLSRL